MVLVNCSRQAGKSTTAAVLALHTALYRPGRLMLLVAPSLRQAAELFSKFADVARPARPGAGAEQDNARSCTFAATGSRICRLPGARRPSAASSAPR